jgi:hypothetical protein
MVCNDEPRVSRSKPNIIGITDVWSLNFTTQVIVVLVPSTVNVCTEFSYWSKSYSNKATLLLCWSYRYKYATVVITHCLTVTKYPYLKWQWVFYFYHKFSFLFSITDNTFTGLDYIYEQHGGCLIRSRNCFPIARTWILFWWCPCWSSFLFSVLCCVLFVFVLYLVCTMFRVYGLSILDYPFGFLRRLYNGTS